MANCNCNCKNGQDVLDFLTSVPGGTAANATYQLGLTHFTCGNRKMLVADPTHPVISQLAATPVGTPIDLGNGIRHGMDGCCVHRIYLRDDEPPRAYRENRGNYGGISHPELS